MRILKITVAAFVAGLLGAPLFLIIEELIGIFNGGGYRLMDFANILVLLICYVGVVITPVCLLVVAPLVHFVPAKAAFWRPIPSTIAGAATGLAGIYLWSAILNRILFIPSWNSETWFFAGLAIVVGASAASATSYLIRCKITVPSLLAERINP